MSDKSSPDVGDAPTDTDTDTIVDVKQGPCKGCGRQLAVSRRQSGAVSVAHAEPLCEPFRAFLETLPPPDATERVRW